MSLLDSPSEIIDVCLIIEYKVNKIAIAGIDIHNYLRLKLMNGRDWNTSALTNRSLLHSYLGNNVDTACEKQGHYLPVSQS